jgi:hypothetical protein
LNLLLFPDKVGKQDQHTQRNCTQEAPAALYCLQFPDQQDVGQTPSHGSYTQLIHLSELCVLAATTEQANNYTFIISKQVSVANKSLPGRC